MGSVHELKRISDVDYNGYHLPASYVPYRTSWTYRVAWKAAVAFSGFLWICAIVGVVWLA